MSTPVDHVAESYVKLALAVGVHDPDYVDAYYGPATWKTEAEASPLALTDIERHATELVIELERDVTAEASDLVRMRRTYLRKQLEAMVVRVRLLQGMKLPFDDEARALYDATPPVHTEQHFKDVLERLAAMLPGDDPVAARYIRYRSEFVIPPEKLAAVFAAAIAAGKQRTAEHIPLPAGESFVVEFVTDKPWSGYNWYKGNFHSVIQVNTSLPIYIDRAVDLACHEGYPGHHVYNALLEQSLVRGHGWPEFSMYALFSPQSLIAEGSANYGIEMAFPDADRAEFERTTLFPLAGLPADRAGEYYAVQALVHELSYAGNEAARRYLNGETDADAAADWLQRYALMTPAAARQRIRFFDKYRSYVINYNLGQDIVKAYVERASGPNVQAGDRWSVFAGLLSTPMVPSALYDTLDER